MADLVLYYVDSLGFEKLGMVKRDIDGVLLTMGILLKRDMAGFLDSGLS